MRLIIILSLGAYVQLLNIGSKWVKHLVRALRAIEITTLGLGLGFSLGLCSEIRLKLRVRVRVRVRVRFRHLHEGSAHHLCGPFPFSRVQDTLP